MLTTIQNALKTKEIRMKLLYVLIGLVIVRIGCNIPIPGTKPDVMQNARYAGNVQQQQIPRIP